MQESQRRDTVLKLLVHSFWLVRLLKLGGDVLDESGDGRGPVSRGRRVERALKEVALSINIAYKLFRLRYDHVLWLSLAIDLDSTCLIVSQSTGLKISRILDLGSPGKMRIKS